MKTSLILSDFLFKKAKKAADDSGTTISSVIDSWARAGFELLTKRKRKPPTFQPVNLGEPLSDLNSRRQWADAVYGDESEPN